MARWSLKRLLGLASYPNPHEHQHEWQRESADHRPLLPQYRHGDLESAFPPDEVTKVALRLRHLIEECVPVEMEASVVTKAHSRVITPRVITAAKEAGGSEYRSCVVFGLLVCKRWFKHQAVVELWDSDLHKVRAVACEVVAKAIIENEDDMSYLLHSVLLRRYTILVDGKETPPANVIEKAVDLHAVRVICSSGYQKCISYLWRGWVVQDEDDPSVFVDYKGRDDRRFIVHMDPDRMRAPVYQNMAQLLISIIYLGLFTAVINTVNPSGDLDTAEIILYIFTFGFICDELIKFWKAGYHIFGFWNAFNSVLYSFLTVSLVLRCIGLTHPTNNPERERFNKLSYNFLACSAPMFWSRLLLYLDSFRFFGAMLVVLQVMMKESIIFFALLLVMIVGFLQAFIGLDLVEDNLLGDTYFIIEAMTKAILQSPEFDGFEKFAPPFGITLYYFFTFIVMVILLNILIALYGSAYDVIYENANDEFLAFFAQKTMQFIRAPDENVYIAPFNLIEMVVAILFEWWMDRRTYEKINDLVMAILYSPLLLVAAYFETRTAHEIRRNRSRGDDDDDRVEEWEQMVDQIDFEAEGWSKKCVGAKSNIVEDPAVQEVKKLRAEVEEMKSLILAISAAVGAGKTPPAGEGSSQEPPDKKGKMKMERQSSDTQVAESSSSSSSENGGD